MTPSPSTRPVKRTGIVGRQVQSKVFTRSVSTSNVNQEERLQQFRDARKAREKQRLDMLKERRLKNSSIAASNACTSVSIPSLASGSRNYTHKLPITSSVVSSNVTKAKVGSNASVSSGVQNSLSSLRTANTAFGASLPQKSHRSQTAGKSILKGKSDKIVGKFQRPGRRVPAEVKLTKTTQLRMLRSDPLLDISQFSTSSSKQIILPPPIPLRNHQIDSRKDCIPKDVTDSNLPEKNSCSSQTNVQHLTKKACFKSPLDKITRENKSHQQSPSRIPIRKTSFASPCQKPSTLALTPKPSPLRERLSEWLKKRDHSLDNFKHLKCFGILGPVVKRPQTPFRKKILSSSTLKAIPESTETSPHPTPSMENLDSSDEDAGFLNSTFTLEDEDKENICSTSPDQVHVRRSIGTPPSDSAKKLDQARGVLSELLKLIQMGYPIEQCQLWLRAIRCRFPQCGDEAVYWECLASLEESSGDLQSAVSCYERALLQGAESSVQNSLDELLKKMSALNIEPIVRVNMRKQTNHENSLLDSSNIIKSSSIHFAVQEKCNSSKKNDNESESSDAVFTATPVRRSLRLAGTPKASTPGMTCVRSLQFLQPQVRDSLVFHGNAALEPMD